MEAPAKTALPVLIIDDSETDREITAHCLGKAWPFEREMAADFPTADLPAREARKSCSM